MSDAESVLHQAVLTLLAEAFDGSGQSGGYILNGGDTGLLGQLETVNAATASARPMPGTTTVAAHVDHVLYGLALLNRYADGETDPWADADWSESWTRCTVDEAAWRDLRDGLREAVRVWTEHVAHWTRWNDVAASGIVASVAHTTYHFGAIRQILAAAGHETGPKS